MRTIASVVTLAAALGALGAPAFAADLRRNLQGASAVAASAAAQGSPENAAAQSERSIQTLVGEKPPAPVSAAPAQSPPAPPDGEELSLIKPLKPPRQFGFHGFDNGAEIGWNAVWRPVTKRADKLIGNSDAGSEIALKVILLAPICAAAFFLGLAAGLVGGFLGAAFGARDPDRGQ